MCRHLPCPHFSGATPGRGYRIIVVALPRISAAGFNANCSRSYKLTPEFKGTASEVSKSFTLNTCAAASITLQAQLLERGLTTRRYFDIKTISTTLSVIAPPPNRPPAFSQAIYSFGMSQSAAVGASVGTVSATDPDSGDSVSYSITAGNSAGVFDIGSSDGAITLAKKLGTATTSYSLTVQAADDRGGTDTTSVSVDVALPPSIRADASSLFVGQEVTLRASPPASSGPAVLHWWQEWSGGRWVDLGSATTWDVHRVTSNVSGLRTFRVVVSYLSRIKAESAPITIEWRPAASLPISRLRDRKLPQRDPPSVGAPEGHGGEKLLRRLAGERAEVLKQLLSARHVAVLPGLLFGDAGVEDVYETEGIVTGMLVGRESACNRSIMPFSANRYKHLH